MASGESDTVAETCVFCLIANNQDRETEIISENKWMVCFRDIYPAAPHHYLVVPRQHIHSYLSMDSGHIGFIERMAEMGRNVLRDQGITDMTDTRLGFHVPPYISVAHLHLHVLAPSSQISDDMIYKFIPGTSSFIAEEDLCKELRKHSSPLRKAERHLKMIKERLLLYFYLFVVWFLWNTDYLRIQDAPRMHTVI
ncbi:adenosine 5'-monophosphoramidase HINT3-like [Platichthys flesus]|uniref:adenosine 5'-monophosphoramidase HINT3-like n=1 Tax=Platichthys flesus TaxID=8260 RepID=UPI002DBFF226|nr:adenosine 5'-monophosphoramidase HINT3-like [Platichthys flesus]